MTTPLIHILLPGYLSSHKEASFHPPVKQCPCIGQSTGTPAASRTAYPLVRIVENSDYIPICFSILISFLESTMSLDISLPYWPWDQSIGLPKFDTHPSKLTPRFSPSMGKHQLKDCIFPISFQYIKSRWQCESNTAPGSNWSLSMEYIVHDNGAGVEWG